MATFGQGINAQLGAIDYSPIQRGSAVGAQLAAQGGQMIGQGLANFGEQVGKGVEKYFKEHPEYFSLNNGDLIFTGTPAGVGECVVGDELDCYIENEKLLSVQIK